MSWGRVFQGLAPEISNVVSYVRVLGVWGKYKCSEILLGDGLNLEISEININLKVKKLGVFVLVIL